MTKQKLVRPQMTTEARDILKSWGGETNSDKVKIMEASYKFIVSRNCEEMKFAMDDRKILLADVKTKTKELSTLAGYLAISVCVNFVAIGWVAWVKGWLS